MIYSEGDILEVKEDVPTWWLGYKNLPVGTKVIILRNVTRLDGDALSSALDTVYEISIWGEKDLIMESSLYRYFRRL